MAAANIFGFTFETIDVKPSPLHVEINGEPQKRPIRDKYLFEIHIKSQGLYIKVDMPKPGIEDHRMQYNYLCRLNILQLGELVFVAKQLKSYNIFE